MLHLRPNGASCLRKGYWDAHDARYGSMGLVYLPTPIGSMYGIFTYFYHKNWPNVGKYTIHGWYGTWMVDFYNSNVTLNIPVPYMDPVGRYLLLMVQKSQTTTWAVENFVIHGINYHINWCRISSINSCKWIIPPHISIGVSPLNRLQTNEVVTNFHGHPSTSSTSNGINLANHQTCTSRLYENL